MNNPREPGPIVAFRDPWPARIDPAPEPQRPADPEWIDYCRTREFAERAAAKQAGCTQGRRVHQELAQAYARMIHRVARP